MTDDPRTAREARDPFGEIYDFSQTFRETFLALLRPDLARVCRSFGLILGEAIHSTGGLQVAPSRSEHWMRRELRAALAELAVARRALESAVHLEPDVDPPRSVRAYREAALDWIAALAQIEREGLGLLWPPSDAPPGERPEPDPAARG